MKKVLKILKNFRKKFQNSSLERVYDQILDSFNTREQATFEQCHIINCDIVDNHEDATLGAIILSQIIDELVQHEGKVLDFLRLTVKRDI